MKRLLLGFMAALVSLQCQQASKKSEAEVILTRACEYLWQHQAADGGWHSKVHGVMKTGQTLTPFILFALTDVPDSVYETPEEGVRKALEFIRTNVSKDGALGVSDPDILEYPNYSTAYGLRVMVKHGAPADSTLIERMKKYLAEQQFVERRGIRPSDPVYGSWGFGEKNIAKGRVGHVDLSHTRHVLQALIEAGHRDADMMRKANRFLRLLQKHPSHESSPRGAYDGGFYFSPVVLDQNKAGRDSLQVFRSYATPTCGGLLALLTTGHSVNDSSVQAAIKWLETNPLLDYPQGIPEDDPDQWRKVLFFYHLYVRAEVYAALDWKGEWRGEMTRLLAERQSADGSFSNPHGGPNKEDDPLLATAFVVGIATRIVATSQNPAPTAGR